MSTTTNDASSPQGNPWHYGWVVVALGALITCTAIGAMLALPVFLAPMGADTGWTRAGIGLAITFNFLSMGAASFFWGSLSDRLGPSRVVLCGVLLLAAGLAWASRAGSLLEFQIAWGVLVGVASGAFMAPLMSTVTLWFDRHRALAVALVSAGIGVAPMTVSPIAAWLMVEHGWRPTMLILAGVVLVLLVPAALLVRKPPQFETAGQAGAPGAPAGGGGATASASLGELTRQAFRSRPFAVLALTFFACCATHAGPIIHTVSYAIGCGLPTMTAVTIYSVEGFAGLVGRLALGLAADRFGVKRIIILGLLTQALAAGAYAAVSRLGEFYAVAFIFGLAYGGVMPLYAALVRSYFDVRIMGSVLGGLSMISSLGMALGPAVGGWIYDHWHTYTWMYLGSLAVGLGAVAIAFALPRVLAPSRAMAAA
jgi:MFS family permease